MWRVSKHNAQRGLSTGGRGELTHRIQNTLSNDGEGRLRIENRKDLALVREGHFSQRTEKTLNNGEWEEIKHSTQRRLRTSRGGTEVLSFHDTENLVLLTWRPDSLDSLHPVNVAFTLLQLSPHLMWPWCWSVDLWSFLCLLSSTVSSLHVVLWTVSNSVWCPASLPPWLP